MLTMAVWLACQGGADSDTVEFPLAPADAPGPYRVGYVTSSFTYSAFDGERTVRVATWYPTEDETGAETKYLGVFPAAGVFEGASLAGATHPVALFTHGHQGFPEYSSFLMRHFASHGWVVVAPEHTTDTTFDPAQRKTEIYLNRPLDLSATLDDLGTRTIDGAPLWSDAAGTRDPVSLIGHSFGGYTAFAVGGASYAVDALAAECGAGTGPSEFCSTFSADDADRLRLGFEDDRFDAIISMAPGDYTLFRDGLATVDVPVLYMNGSLDPAVNAEADFRAGLVGERYVRIEGADHQSFTDFAGQLDHPDGLIPPSDGWAIVSTYTLLFARAVRGDEASNDALRGVIDARATLSE
jgi:predicted dienelactone hydrolase